MEKFKAVEKAMKTKAYSKEGLSAASRLDPKERAKMEACDFLGNMVDELEQQVEAMEAETEAIQATMKKGKNQSTKADRMAELERLTERHKWHQGKLELMKRSLENGGLETEQVTDLEETIRYYVTDGMNEEFMEDDEMYDDLNLVEEENVWGMVNENDHVSSQDAQSVQDDLPDVENRSNSIPGGKAKSASVTEPPTVTARRPSTQMRSPLPALATLNTPLSSISNGIATSNMKPASLPTRAPGETLKYASAAAAAAANDINGIAPLPPPPGLPAAPVTNGYSGPQSSGSGARASNTTSPAAVASQPSSLAPTPAQKPSIPVVTAVSELAASMSQKPSPALSHSSVATKSAVPSVPQTPKTGQVEVARPSTSRTSSGNPTVSKDAGDISQGASCFFPVAKGIS